MAKGDKTILNKLRVLLRRAWSFRQCRISTCTVLIIIIFLCIFGNTTKSNNNLSGSSLSVSVGEGSIGFASDPSFYENMENNINKRIACLIVTDPDIHESENKEIHDYAVSEMFTSLQVYDKYLSPYCSLNIFVVNQSISSYHFTSTQISTKLPNSNIIFLQKSELSQDEERGKERRYINHKILQYSFKYLLTQNFQWFLKLHSPDSLILIDHFAKIVYDKNGQNNNKYDMSVPHQMGHYIKSDKCDDFIFSSTPYAINAAFIKRFGDKKYSKLSINDIMSHESKNCKKKSCEHDQHDDYPWACLSDWNVDIKPFRDENDREYILLYTVRRHYVKMNQYIDNDWYWNGKNKKSVGNNCCAKYPVAFSGYGDAAGLRKDYQIIYMQKAADRTMEFISKVRYFDEKDIALPPNVTQKNELLKYYMNDPEVIKKLEELKQK